MTDTNNLTEAARAYLRAIAKKGGLARARRLSPERRSQISRKAALARHRKPKADNA